jgi:hypothetical protein
MAFAQADQLDAISAHRYDLSHELISTSSIPAALEQYRCSGH